MIPQSRNVTLVPFEGLGRWNRVQRIDSFHPKTERQILQEPKQKQNKKKQKPTTIPAVLLELLTCVSDTSSVQTIK